MSGPRVVVIGGGLAGLTAALAVADRGGEVVLLERRPRLGGATWSFQRHGCWFDNGQHVFLRCCTAYRGLLERLGVADRVVLQDRLEIPVIAPGGRRSWLRRGVGPAPLHLARSLLGYRHLPVADRLRLGRVARALRGVDPEAPYADTQNFGAWLQDQGQSEVAIDRLWDVIVRPTLNIGARDASLAMAAMVLRTALFGDRAAGDLGWARVPLAELHARAATAALTRVGVRVHQRARVDAIETMEGAVSAVRVDGERLAADAVVVAVPHDEVAGLLPRGALDAPERCVELGMSPIVNVHVIYDRRVTELAVAACIDSPVEWVFDRTEAAGVEDGQCLSVSISAATAELGQPAAALIRTHVAALAGLFPAAADARVREALVTREGHATFRAVPGSGARRPPSDTGISGLFLAGAWTSTGWPATMEGAVRSGLVAAAKALPSARVADGVDGYSPDRRWVAA